MKREGSEDLERIDLWLDGALGPEDAEPWIAALASSPSLRRKVEEFRQLHTLLEESRIPVRQGFVADTLKALQPAPWQVRTPSAWLRPVAALAALVAVALALVVFGGKAPGVGFEAVLTGWFGLLVSATEAAFEVSRRSWEGLSFGVREWWLAEPGTMLLALVGFFGLQFALWRWATRGFSRGSAR